MVEINAASKHYLFSAYGIKLGTLVIDDSDKEQSKNTTKNAKVHKIKNKNGIMSLPRETVGLFISIL